MHVLERNKQYLWYANPTGVEYKVDENGYKTGEKEITYSAPVRVRMSMAISSGANNLGSQGMAELERYGIATGYTHKAVTDDLNCQMNEESIVWYNAQIPVVHEGEEWGELAEETWGEINEGVWDDYRYYVENHPHNFKVVRKARSLNHLIYYLKEVDVG